MSDKDDKKPKNGKSWIVKTKPYKSDVETVKEQTENDPTPFRGGWGSRSGRSNAMIRGL